MSEDLQHLLTKIKTEAVDQAEQQAADIVGQAEKKAAALVQEAKEQALRHMEKAEKDSVQFENRSTQSIQQAARDVLISLRQEIEKALGNLVRATVDKSLEPAPLADLLGKAVQAYLTQGQVEGGLEVVLSPSDQKALAASFKKQFGDQLKGGLEIGSDEGLLKGFRITTGKEDGYHDFSDEALTEALAHFLRPHLAEAVRTASPEPRRGAAAE